MLGHSTGNTQKHKMHAKKKAKILTTPKHLCTHIYYTHIVVKMDV